MKCITLSIFYMWEVSDPWIDNCCSLFHCISFTKCGNKLTTHIPFNGSLQGKPRLAGCSLTESRSFSDSDFSQLSTLTVQYFDMSLWEGEVWQTAHITGLCLQLTAGSGSCKWRSQSCERANWLWVPSPLPFLSCCPITSVKAQKAYHKTTESFQFFPSHNLLISSKLQGLIWRHFFPFLCIACALQMVWTYLKHR